MFGSILRGGKQIWVREETNLGSTGGIPGDGGVLSRESAVIRM